MERTNLFGLMSELKLYGMRLAYDEVMATGIKRQHEPPQIVGVSMAETKCARRRRKSVPVWLIKKGSDALGSVCLV